MPCGHWRRMSQHEPSNTSSIYVLLAGIALLVILAGLAGWILGGQAAPVEEPSAAKTAVARPAKPAPVPTATPAVEPPLYFHVHVPSGAGQAVVADEVAMAAEAGIHQYVIDVPLPWDGNMDAFLKPISVVLKRDPAARFYLYVDLNAPAAWLSAHPDETVTVAGKPQGFASLASEVWRKEAQSALEAMVSAMKTSEHPEQVLGYIVGCLEGGGWYRSEGYDASPPNLAAFRNWVTGKYKDNATLDKAWGDADATFEKIAALEQPNTDEACQAFFTDAASQRYIDFLTFTSDATADTILLFVRSIKNTSGDNVRVFAPYGYSYELLSGCAGHFALSRLLDSEIDGFVSPVSYVDRGLGGVGGAMGPVHSVAAHGKQWLLVDDTRTGLERDPASGEITRPKNVRAEDVYCVQQRNFATALTEGLGLVWSDPQGDGWLHDKEMWRGFARMRNVYTSVLDKTPKEEDSPYPDDPTLAVVVDEESRFHQRCDRRINDLLLNQVRDTALRTGVPTKFYLLRDVIERKVPLADVYLFLNAFHLTVHDREQLHAVLQEGKAPAIWMYAPGYIDDDDASAENVAATTRIAVKQFDGPAQTGSECLLPANWVNKGEEFGPTLTVEPLFYIDDPESNIIAEFTASGKPSVAVSFFEGSWSSIFCAEPALTPGMLRQLLRLLELHVYYDVTPTKFFDSTSFGANLMAIHAKETGERIVDLDQVCDVQDLLAPEIGWPRKRSVTLSMKTGETRLLKLTPVAEETGQ